MSKSAKNEGWRSFYYLVLRMLVVMGEGGVTRGRRPVVVLVVVVTHADGDMLFDTPSFQALGSPCSGR